MIKNLKENFIKLAYSLTTFKIFKSIKLSYIIGSKAAFFSLSQAVAPTTGLLFNRDQNIMLFLSRVVLFLFNGFNPLFTLLYHIPTFFGALYLNTHSKLAKSLLPILSIILFLFHPFIISQDIYTKLYCIYFAIPILIAIFNTKSIFLKCLGSTFTTHAVGSIIWLYTHNLDQNIYYNLINIVWVERLLFALVMTGTYYIYKYTETLLNTYLEVEKNLKTSAIES